MVHFITWTSISMFKFNLCAVLTKIQPTTTFKIYIYIYSAPKSADVTFQNLEGKFWLVDVAEFSLALG
jgi:hypothetical protein